MLLQCGIYSIKTIFIHELKKVKKYLHTKIVCRKGENSKMSYYELFCNIKRKLEDIKSLSDIVNIEKLIDYMNCEETKMIIEENNSDLPF